MVKEKKPGPPPDRTSLHEAALRHLARYAVTEAGLRRVLERRVRRWATAAKPGEDVIAEALGAVAEVARDLSAAGVVDDAAFAVARVARLARAGRSRRATSAHLAAKGVDPETAASALPEPGAELQAAAIHVRKRRLGPFRSERSEAEHVKDLAALARAGFARDVAERALALDLAEAEDLVLAARRGA